MSDEVQLPDEDGLVQLHASAQGHARIYQVAQGNLYVGTDEARTAVHKIAAMPVGQAVEALLQLSRDELISVLAQMDNAPAATRLAALPNATSIDFLLSIDEQLAYQRLAAMETIRALELLNGIPIEVARKFLAGISFPQAIALVAQHESDEDGDSWYRVRVPDAALVELALRLPIGVIGSMIEVIHSELGAQVIHALGDRGFMAWLAAENKRQLVLEHVTDEWLHSLVTLLQAPDLGAQCVRLGVHEPDLVDVLRRLGPDRGSLGAERVPLGVERVAQLLYQRTVPPDIFARFDWFFLDTLVETMGTARSAELFQDFPNETLNACIALILRSVKPKSPAFRRIAAVLAKMQRNVDFVFAQVEQNTAYWLWEARWAASTAGEIEGMSPFEANRYISQLDSERLAEIVWHLPPSCLFGMLHSSTSSIETQRLLAVMSKGQRLKVNLLGRGLSF